MIKDMGLILYKTNDLIIELCLDVIYDQIDTLTLQGKQRFSSIFAKLMSRSVNE